MWSSVRGGLRGAGEPAQRLPGPPLRHQGGQHRASDPQAQDGELLPRWLLERRQRAETALTTVVATCYLLGVSTRRLERLAEALGITRLSKSQVSEMAKELDGLVESFRTRPLDQGPYRFVWADALVVKVREGGSIVGVHVLIATGVNAEGRREILGCEVTSAEDGAGWLAFFRSLVARGLHGVQLVTSDAHPGLVAAIRATLPGASWQRCRTHSLRELLTKVAKSSQPWVATMVRTIFDQPDATEVKAQFDRVVETLEAKLPVAAAHLQEAREDLLAFSCFPRQIWRRSGAPTPKNGSTARSDAGPTWSGSFPTAARSFASSAPCSWNRPTSGPSRAATWEPRSSPRSTRPSLLPPAPTLPQHPQRSIASLREPDRQLHDPLQEPGEGKFRGQSQPRFDQELSAVARVSSSPSAPRHHRIRHGITLRLTLCLSSIVACFSCAAVGRHCFRSCRGCNATFVMSPRQ
jgi:putative transposase